VTLGQAFVGCKNSERGVGAMIGPHTKGRKRKSEKEGEDMVCWGFRLCPPHGPHGRRDPPFLRNTNVYERKRSERETKKTEEKKIRHGGRK